MRQQSGQSPVFRSGVDLLTLDVTVVDKDGAPIRGLTANDFVVKIDGQQRAVRALDYQVFGPAGELERSSKLTSTTRTADSRSAGGGGRIILILFDDLSAKPGDAKGLVVAAERVLGLLSGDDLVGLVTTSGFGPVLSPTRDRAALVAALHSRGLVGRYDDSSGPFFVTVKEAMDTVDAPRGVMNGVVGRECADSTLGESCRTLVEAAANRLVALTRRRAEAQVDAFKTAIEALRSVPKPRIVLALSSGVAFGAGRSLQEDFELISHAAADASVQFYALTEVGDAIDMRATGRPVPPPYDRVSAQRLENNYLMGGLQSVAAATGGEVFKVVGQADRFFARIFKETSGVYRLGVESSPTPPAARFLDVAVSANRPGATIRVNRQMIAPDATGTPATPDETLQNRLVQGGFAFGVPISLGTVLRQDSSGHLQLGVEAEVPATVKAPLSTAFALVDQLGKVVESGQRQVLHPVDSEDYRITFGLGLVGGSYRLRFVVADGNGSVGSVQRAVSAQLVRYGPLQASDLMMAWINSEGTPRLLALDTLPAAANILRVSLELYPDDLRLAPQVHVQFRLLRASESVAIAARDVVPSVNGTVLTATASLSAPPLAPGEYVIALDILSGTTRLGAVSTSFRKAG
ncbi:MAG TPA: VWA domain-containing protein [Vicinamibacterales bacterium]|nr:VWA domain-containing protein [Vicinamibacterales bacterium]